MAFSSDDALRGAGTIWVTFLVLLATGVALSIVIPAAFTVPSAAAMGSAVQGALIAGFMAAAVALLPAAVVMAVGAPIGMLLGSALRRVRSLTVHLIVYTGLGLVIGGAAEYVFTGWRFFEPGWLGYVPSVPAVAATLAVPLGWWLNARHLLRGDALIASADTADE